MSAKRGGYESAASLRGTRETHELISAPSTVTKAEYDAVSEYACALKAEKVELKSDGRDNVATISTLEAASAATKTTTRIIAEMCVAHAENMRKMYALVAELIYWF